jgi:Cu2+-containing amine oxidase
VLTLSTACALAACAGAACSARAGRAGTAGAAAAQTGGQTAPQQAPQLLDPLTAAEKATAEKLVRADARAKELLGPSATLASIELLAMKDAAGTATAKDEPVRHADLLFSRPDTDSGARAIVNLSAAPSIVEFTRIDRRSVPATAADIQEAWRIALADTTFRTRLARDPGGITQEALRIYTEDPNDPCFTGRCFYLIAKQGDFYVSTASVTVDLATRRILPERSPK